MLSILAFVYLTVGDPAPAPRLDVLEGRVSVLATESWLSLASGEELPQSRPRTTLRLDWNSRARLSVAGAGVELCGPLEVVSSLDGAWTLRIDGRGEARIDARSVPVNVELAHAASLELRRGIYWTAGIPAGGWRVGCLAGQALILHPPEGASWSRANQVQAGDWLRLVPHEVASSARPPVQRKPAAVPWTKFSWPWTSSKAPGE